MAEEHEFLLETSEFAEVLTDIGELVTTDFSEDEVQMVFLNEGYFQLLGYERIGVNLRSELSVESGVIDYITSGHGDSIRDTNTVVYEFKNPRKPLNKHKNQLVGYMDNTEGVGAKYGVLTNGQRFQLHRKRQPEPQKILDFSLESATTAEASLIILSLGYWSIEEQNIKPVAEKTAQEVVDLIPEELHLKFSEENVNIFAKHFARYLRQEFSN